MSLIDAMVWDLIWGPISNLRNDDVLDYRIEIAAPEPDTEGCSCGMADKGAPGHDHTVALVTCDECDATSESGWGDTPLCLKCEKPENICTKHNRTFVGHCPLVH